MTRIMLQYLLPLLLPFVLYIGWVWVSRQINPKAEPWRVAEGPWFWLIGAGFTLMAGGLIYLGLSSGSDPGGTYQPPRYEGGKIIPGRVVPESDKNRGQ